jgi:hypothetical protein
MLEYLLLGLFQAKREESEKKNYSTTLLINPFLPLLNFPLWGACKALTNSLITLDSLAPCK